ncbi:MAG: hypothetical protein IKZ02_00805 [Alphaproteobacteria bacterium]|nr:hypothetical protein [Alphaproteobacteria bacterium]MBR4931544.1 hypothetical protein [Alphaproteobacteria bacterium]
MIEITTNIYTYRHSGFSPESRVELAQTFCHYCNQILEINSEQCGIYNKKNNNQNKKQ